MQCLNRKCKVADCHDHTFSLKSQRADTYYRQSVSMPLCPKLDRDGKVAAHAFPTFNLDGKWYTPAFSLDMDKSYTLEMDQQMLYDQQRKIREAQENKREIFVPKPSHKNKYCSACKSNYEDYLDHIKSSLHKKAVSKSKYNKHILELCSSLFKTQETVKSDREETTKEKSEEDIVPKISKKRKLDSKTQTVESNFGQTYPMMVPFNYELLALYNKMMMSQLSMSAGFGTPYNYMQYPFQFSQPPVGYQMFVPQQTLFQQFPIMINTQTGNQ